MIPHNTQTMDENVWLKMFINFWSACVNYLEAGIAGNHKGCEKSAFKQERHNDLEQMENISNL